MAFGLNTGNRLPHSLRLVIFFLRLAVGLDFLYLGMDIAFGPAVRNTEGMRALGDLHIWLSSISNTSSLQTVFAWAFLIIGACLILGLMTRLASIAGIILVGISFAPNLSYTVLNISRFVSDSVIIIFCLIIIFIANIGTYFGLDRFIHFGAKKEM